MSAPVATRARLRELQTATPALITEVSLDGVLRRVVRVAAQIIGSRYATIGVVGRDGQTLESFTTYGIDSEVTTRIGPPPHANMHSVLDVPIFGSGGVFGKLYLAEKVGEDGFTEEDEELAILLAAKTAAAVENARHHEESDRLLEEVQQLHRARERFFAMVNHELRNALAGVYGWAEMLVRKRDPASVPRAAFEVLDSAQRAVTLIDDLLDLSRLDEDRLQPVIKVVDASSMALRAINRVTPAAELKRIDLVLTSDTALPNCATDASRVEQPESRC